MMRPLFLEFPDAGGAWTLDHLAPGQFMWGRDLMVAPAPHGESPAPYPVLLPPGDWYDYWTGRLVTGARDAEVMVEGRLRPAGGGGGTGLRLLTVTPRRETLPVYVRAGAIVPRHGVIQSTAEVPQGPLELHVFPAAECRGSVYADDGVGFAYRDGGFLRCRYRGERSADGLAVREESAEGSFQPWWRDIAVILHDVPPPWPRSWSNGRRCMRAFHGGPRRSPCPARFGGPADQAHERIERRASRLTRDQPNELVPQALHALTDRAPACRSDEQSYGTKRLV